MAGRLIESLATTEAFAELFSDASVLRGMLDFEVGLARSQARVGMIPQVAADAIAAEETHNRLATLLYLAVSAWHVKGALDEENPPFRYKAFSEIALRICSERIYQQNMPEIFAEFESRSASHERLMRAVRARLEEGKDFLANSLKRSKNRDSTQIV